jgi:hypothetical protein
MYLSGAKPFWTAGWSTVWTTGELEVSARNARFLKRTNGYVPVSLVRPVKHWSNIWVTLSMNQVVRASREQPVSSIALRFPWQQDPKSEKSRENNAFPRNSSPTSDWIKQATANQFSRTPLHEANNHHRTGIRFSVKKNYFFGLVLFRKNQPETNERPYSAPCRGQRINVLTDVEH